MEIERVGAPPGLGSEFSVLMDRLTAVALKADLAGRVLVDDPARSEQEMREVAGVARASLAELRAWVQP